MTLNNKNNDVILEENEMNYGGGQNSNRHIEPHSAAQLTKRKNKVMGGESKP